MTRVADPTRDRSGFVFGAVVDDYDLVPLRFERLGFEGGEQKGKARCLVPHRHNDRNARNQSPPRRCLPHFDPGLPRAPGPCSPMGADHVWPILRCFVTIESPQWGEQWGV